MLQDVVSVEEFGVYPGSDELIVPFLSVIELVTANRSNTSEVAERETEVEVLEVGLWLHPEAWKVNFDIAHDDEGPDPGGCLQEDVDVNWNVPSLVLEVSHFTFWADINRVRSYHVHEWA